MSSSAAFSGEAQSGLSAYNPRLMAAIMEREIKLAFRDREEAKAAILAAGATPLRGRRLQEDCLLDTADDQLRRKRCVLRVRMECGKTLLTFKGPVQVSPMKLREELETVVGDGLLLLRVLEQLGFRVWFRYQKYREEFAREDVTVAIDETPVGTFVEIEGSEQGIDEMALALARKPADYLLDSYRGLFVKHCESRGVPVADMLFEES
jgi:adenylate cyclase class 2